NKEDMLVIERDNFEGAAARFKKIFLVNLNEVDNNGFLVKRELVDLSSIADPNNIGGQGNGLFDFPFQTIESVIPLSGTRCRSGRYCFIISLLIRPGSDDPWRWYLPVSTPLDSGDHAIKPRFSA